MVFFAKMFEQFTENDFKEKKEKEQFKHLGQEHTQNLQNFQSSYNNKMDLYSSNQPDYNNVEDLKKVIYKTYAKSIDKSKENKKKERKKLKNIMNLLIYLQMKKVELKLNYFSEFEKMVQYEKQQIKTLESQLIGDKIHLAMKKSELTILSNKLKDSLKTNSELLELNHFGSSGILEKVDRFNSELDNRIMDLN